MHWIDRGPEPSGIHSLHDTYTGGWVNHYRHGAGKLPTDRYWRNFIDTLRERSFGLCAYCEGIARGEVDHFRPKSKFPELVYSWSNWLFACHDCNHSKSNRWPASGYIDPCGSVREERPERYFQFDLLTGMIQARPTLSDGDRQKASAMIGDLRLNGRHHLKRRLIRTLEVEALLGGDPENVNDATRSAILELASREHECSSVVRALLLARGLRIEEGAAS